MKIYKFVTEVSVELMVRCALRVKEILNNIKKLKQQSAHTASINPSTRYQNYIESISLKVGYLRQF